MGKNKSILTVTLSSLSDINKTYEDTIAAMEYKYSVDKNALYVKDFFGLDPKTIKEEYVTLATEIGREFSLTLMASIEAVLRRDFIVRCHKRNKRSDVLTKTFNEQFNPAKPIFKYDFSDFILKSWKKYLEDRTAKDVVNRMNELLQYRHWLAHGRYWELPQNLSNIDYLTIYHICVQFMAVVSPKLCV